MTTLENMENRDGNKGVTVRLPDGRMVSSISLSEWDQTAHNLLGSAFYAGVAVTLQAVDRETGETYALLAVPDEDGNVVPVARFLTSPERERTCPVKKDGTLGPIVGIEPLLEKMKNADQMVEALQTFAMLARKQERGPETVN